MIRFEPIRGRSIISRREGAMVGKFDDFQFDIRTWSIYGYRLRSPQVFGRAGGVEARDLEQVGRDVVFISEEGAIQWTGASRNTEEGRAWASRYLGTKVISRDGTSLGEVDDLVFDPAGDHVVALVLSGERLVELNEWVATGHAAVVIPEASSAVPMPDQQPNESPSQWWVRVKEGLLGGLSVGDGASEEDPGEE